MHEVTLYTRKGCSLCLHAKSAILALRGEVDFVFREVDIDSDPALYDEHRYDIPVVEVDGARAFKYRVDAGVLRERLRA